MVQSRTHHLLYDLWRSGRSAWGAFDRVSTREWESHDRGKCGHAAPGRAPAQPSALGERATTRDAALSCAQTRACEWDVFAHDRLSGWCKYVFSALRLHPGTFDLRPGSRKQQCWRADHAHLFSGNPPGFAVLWGPFEPGDRPG